MVLLHFDYCDTVYMTSLIRSLNKLQLVQNSACRTILFANRYTSVIDMHTDLKIYLLYVRRNQHMASGCHRNIYFEDRASLGHFYVPIVRPNAVQTRSEIGNCMQIPRVRTKLGEKAMSVRGPKFWNSIKRELRNIESLDAFKNAISDSATTMFENHPT